MFSKGNLIRCTRDNDIGIVLDVDDYNKTMRVMWVFDGLSDQEPSCQTKWVIDDLFVLVSK